ncbi:phage tail tube protein [Streptomyces sp. BRA346]|uniref:phage tail tube protein n=1 Tax=Streptomyces sp. BRA346 TaxID=2878199 RepID=UPI00406339FF
MAQQRFMRRGITKILWLKSIASADLIPTRAEISTPNATDLTEAISDVDGWSLTNEAIETPDMASTFTPSIPGNDKADNSSLTFYEDQFHDDMEMLLPKGATGYVVFLRKGDIPGSKSMDAFPVQVASRTAQYNAGNEAAKFQAVFTITSPPTLDAPVPSAATATGTGKGAA